MEVSSTTRQLLTDLKDKFVEPRVEDGGMKQAAEMLGLTTRQQHQIRSSCKTKREAWGLAMQLARGEAADSQKDECGSISDECFLFTHIVDCVKALQEVTEANRLAQTGSSKAQVNTPTKGGGGGGTSSTGDATSLPLYAGFVTQIERSMKDLVHPASAAFADSSPPTSSPLNNSLNRCVATVHALSAFPSLTQTEPDQATSKKLPLLHFAAYNAHSLDAVKALYYSNPDNIRARDKTGALPLHWAILNKESPEVTQFLLDAYPEAASEPDNAGYLPLHWAVNNDAVNMTIIKSLLQKCPSAASTPSTKNKTLPLHWCVNRSEPNLALVKELVVSYPDAIHTPCDHGWLPLHYCVNRAKVSLTILRLLLDKHPSGVSHRNSDGQMPLHRLLDRYEPNRKAVKWLIEAEPATLKACDSEGYLPLHVALDGSKPPSWRLIKLLLQHAPQTVQITTLDGFLPLHVAMKMQDRFGNPSAASITSSGGGNNQDEGVSHDKADNTSSDGQSALEREAAMKLNQNRYLSIVQELVTLYPDAVHQPAVDIVPVKDGVNPDTWEGQWRKSRWTPYSRAMGKGKHTPIAKLLRPYKKKDGSSSRMLNAGKSGELMGSPSRYSTVPGGGSSSKFETSSPAVTPSHHHSPVEVQLQSKLLGNSHTSGNSNNTAQPNSHESSNNISSMNYGNMGDVLPRISSPRKSPCYNPSDSGIDSGYTIQEKQTLQTSKNADLYGSLKSLARQTTEANEESFWGPRKIEVKEAPTTFTIDNDASAKTW
eukprot:CAMPEP_0114431960 /NCGR_PEP_ID=MMETSP0103-20121206/10895_1 /TAXON_ID=37642 ORGANISM="Paraphysomonas imperforata, Strain PA2" /NCGR_SAMPLE_ID=MMETSP0103 /ASSEMBLY_ACC=CAM_ASM_000201 /LENGTH=767 /DNA_ID=CAMNT_0001601593 /DNA_START=113 /DNA_END=2413 /DNA_ORIENTATION=-